MPSRYRVLLAFGASYSVGAQLANVSSVLPYLLAEKSIVWAAGVLFPTFSIGFVAGNALSPIVVERSRRHQNVIIAAAAATIAALTACIAASALSDVLVAVVFLSASLVIGCAMGMANNAYAEIISRMLYRSRRNQLLLNQELQPPRRIVETYREGVIIVRTRTWYRLFLAAQIAFVPVGLGMTFFSLRAAAEHSGQAASVHVLVISSAAGLLAGLFVWRAIFGRFGVRGMLVMSGTINSVAALIAIAHESIPGGPHLWVHGIVFFLATLANGATGAATVSWICAFATEERRAILISFAAALTARVSAILGAALGTMAQITTQIWPVVMMLIFGVIAAAVALRAPDRPPVPSDRTA